MNTFVADPHWGWWIVFYFYLGGIAAGAYFMATMIELFARDLDRPLARVGYYLAAPLAVVCGVLLILDLNYPLRFWHMLMDAESWRPHMKYWSPMSVGAWALLVFGVITGVSLLGALAEDRRFGLGRWAGLAHRLHRSPLGRSFDVIGTGCGFFIASYTGVLLTATNQPLWSDSPWIGAMFLASAASTGIAAMIVLSRFRRDSVGESLERLERAENWAMVLELTMIMAFLISLGNLLLQAKGLLLGPIGLLVFVSVPVGILLPALLRFRARPLGSATPIAAALLVLAGGFVLRVAVVGLAPAALDIASR